MFCTRCWKQMDTAFSNAPDADEMAPIAPSRSAP
jgi:hypothetical protein